MVSSQRMVEVTVSIVNDSHDGTITTVGQLELRTQSGFVGSKDLFRRGFGNIRRSGGQEFDGNGRENSQ